MNNLYIVIVEDQKEVLDAVSNDLSAFEDFCHLEECQEGEEAMEVMREIDEQGDLVAVLITDHIMPGMTGVELLTAIKGEPYVKATKKIMLTGLATHEDTINAINLGSIDRYIEKPWDKEELTAVVRKLLTNFILESGMDYEQYMEYLDKPTLFKYLSG
ncbi:MAG: response regulator [Cyclobacteriaceae bacterium]|nr:response regulator [Cyclobacteriaceae bacterium]